jgi:transposase-like protein
MDFKNLPELIRYFSDEKTAWDYLEFQKWDGTPTCPHCGSTKVYRLKEGPNFKCGNRECDRKFNAKVGSIFENSKIPLSKWYAAIYIATAHKKGISSHQLARDLGVTQKTGWFMLHRIRELARVNNDVELSDTIQVDETYVKGKMANKSKRNRALIRDGLKEDVTTIVLGGVENGGKGFLRVIPNTMHETVKPIIQEMATDAGTVLVTDSSNIYNGMERIYTAHITVNHSIDEYVRDGYHTNQVEGFFSLLKRGIIGIYHSTSPKHLQRYCDEFSYRYNTRKIKDADRFRQTMQKTEGRLTYARLIEKD